MPKVRATSLVVLADAKAYLDVTNTSKDDEIIAIADAASEFLERHTGFLFVTRTVVETRDGNGTHTMNLREWPTTAITTLTIRRAPGETPETILAADMDVDFRMGRIRLAAAAFTRGFQNVVITHVAGFDDRDGTAIPADIERTCKDLIKMKWDELRSGAIAANSISIGQGSFVIKPDWPKDIRDTLTAWRKPVCAYA